jgi:hypothetical protein
MASPNSLASKEFTFQVSSPAQPVRPTLPSFASFLLNQRKPPQLAKILDEAATCETPDEAAASDMQLDEEDSQATFKQRLCVR